MRLRLVNPFYKASVATQLAIAQWHNVVNGELDQISPENEQLVPVHIEQLCNQIMLNAKQNLNALVCPRCNCRCRFFCLYFFFLWILDGVCKQRHLFN